MHGNVQYFSFFSSKLKTTIFTDNKGNFFNELPRNYPQTQKFKIEKPEDTPETFENIITLPIFSDEFNPDASYLPRSKRKEWAVIGLLGKLRIRTAEKITGNKVDINAQGIAVNGTTYTIIKRLQEYDDKFGVVVIFFK